MPAKTAAQEVRDLYQDHLPFWQVYREAMATEEAFLDGDRYEDDHGAHNRDRRLTQIRGQETQDTIRHVSAKATEKPRSVEPRPIDRIDDPETGEIAASLVELELANPWKMFDDCLEEAIISAREKRLGVVWMDWDPDCGEFGEMLYRFLQPDRVMWDPAYHPHHPKCDWLIEDKRVDVEKAKKLYKADWIQPDRDCFTSSGKLKSDVPVMRDGTGRSLPDFSLVRGDRKCTLWFCWYKNDESIKPGGSLDYRPIEDPEQHYMSCLSCGYRSPTQAILRAEGKIQGELPEILEQGCPICGADLKRVDALDEEATVRAYERGKRLVIVAPFSPNPEDKPLYDGKWPIPRARSFPGLFITAYTKPGKPLGPSDTTLMWDQQVAADNLRTLALQRVFEHRNYWILPRVGITDFKGQRFNFREDQFNVMYRDGSISNMGPMDVQLLNGSGLDPGWSTAFMATQQALTQYRGMADLGLTPERSKDIAASSIAQMNQMGEVPTAHFNRRKNRELSRFYGVVWDYVRATYTPERLKRLRLDGIDVLAGIAGDELPNFDFVISDTPEFTGLEKARAEAFQVLLQVGQQMPEFMDIFAEMNNMPPSVVRKIKQRLEELKAQMVVGGGGGGGANALPPSGGGPGLPSSPKSMDASLQPEAAGMVPAGAG